MTQTTNPTKQLVRDYMDERTRSDDLRPAPVRFGASWAGICCRPTASPIAPTEIDHQENFMTTATTMRAKMQVRDVQSTATNERLVLGAVCKSTAYPPAPTPAPASD